MGPPQAQQPRLKLRCRAAQLSGRRPSHAAAQASSSVLLSDTSPFAHRPHGAAQAGSNRGVFHSRAGEFLDHETFLKRRRLSLMVHDTYSSCIHSFPLRHHIPSIHSLQAVRLGETIEGYDFSRLNNMAASSTSRQKRVHDQVRYLNLFDGRIQGRPNH
jgi:hypothetical protein